MKPSSNRAQPSPCSLPDVLGLPTIDRLIASTAKALYADGKPAEALNLLEERMQLLWSGQGENAAVVHMAAKIHLELSTDPKDRHHTLAKRYASRVVKHAPSQSRGCQLLGDIYLRESEAQELSSRDRDNKIQHALDLYQAALTTTDRPGFIYGKICLAYRRLQRFDEARAAAAKMVSLEPGDERALYQQANVEVEASDFLKAREYIEQLLNIAPNNPRGWDLRFLLSMAEGAYDEALVAAERLLELRPQEGKYQVKRFEAALAKGDTDLAREVSEGLIRMQPGCPIGWSLKVKVELEAGNNGAARQAAEKQMELDPDHRISLSQLITVLVKAGDFEEARQFASELMKRAPNDPVATYHRARVEIAAGEPRTAQQQISEFLNRNPGSTMLRGLYIDLAHGFGQIEEAKKAIDELLKLDPADSKALLYKGRYAFLDNDFNTARDCGLKLLKTHHPAHLFFVQLLVAHGQFNPDVFSQKVGDAKDCRAIARADARFVISEGTKGFLQAHLNRWMSRGIHVGDDLFDH